MASRFRFPLASVLTFRQQEADRELAAVRALSAECDRIRFACDSLSTEREQAHHAAVGGTDWLLLDDYKAGQQRQLAALEHNLAQAEARLEAQQLRAVEAARAVRLLEKLRDQQQAQWQQGVDRSAEELNAEIHLALRHREGQE